MPGLGLLAAGGGTSGQARFGASLPQDYAPQFAASPGLGLASQSELPAGFGQLSPGFAALYQGQTMRPAVAPRGFKGATDYQRFRNAPSDFGEALTDPAYLGGQLAALGLGALTGTTGPGLLFGPLLSNFFAREFDPTFGREQSAIRATPGSLPFGGLINTATGASFTPPTINDIIAARAQQILAQAPSPLALAQRAAPISGGGAGNVNISQNAVSPAARANVATQLARLGGSASSMFANPVVNALSAALRARAIPQTQQRRESGSGSSGGGSSRGSNPGARGGSSSGVSRQGRQGAR